MHHRSRDLATIAAGILATAVVSATAKADDIQRPVFERVAVFPVLENTDITTVTAAEIVDVTRNGQTLVYTDSETESIGFVDIGNPASPEAAGIIALDGEPTSVAVLGNRLALAGVNTSVDLINTSGKLTVINIRARQIVAELDLGGQPDAVSISPDGRYAAVAIENERDEDLGDGEPPQAPPGYLVIVDLDGPAANWQTRIVELTGIADLFPEDPEPEYVDINDDNIAVVTLQENNHIVLVDVVTGEVINDFSAGTVDLEQIDILENDLIEPNSNLDGVPREPDGAVWLDNERFATADEGDLFGGSRGITIFDVHGNVEYAAGNSLEHQTIRLGHYPEGRSENKGNEPENVAFARFGFQNYLFAGSERSSVIFVYEVSRRSGEPQLLQTLPAGVAPEGLLPIPRRGLFVAASEADERESKFRSVLNIYARVIAEPAYPTIISEDREDGTPLPWAALSALAATGDDDLVYTAHDSFYVKSRLYSVDVSERPAKITGEIVLTDTLGALAAQNASLVNDDLTVNIDIEGLAARENGGFWVASEGVGTVGDPARPVEALNLLLEVAADGTIESVVTLPDSTNGRQVRFGFEGVTVVEDDGEEELFVAIQREWADDPDNQVRIGRYNVESGEWRFYYYPLDLPESGNGGWVGLSEITAIDDDEFLVVERDNQAGPDAAVKRIYQFSVDDLEPLEDTDVGTTPSFPVVSKTLVRDLMPDLEATNGLVLEKIEGLAVLSNGDVLVVNDNDGVDDSNGETQLLTFEELLDD
ncbi:MAG: esterase-like activity of phytase family protein [Pseudomonadota bacterium]